jgi:hypothetical protein
MATPARKSRQTPSPAFQTVSGPSWQQWNTLQKLRASLFLIWALDALLLALSVVGAQIHREAVKGIGKDTAPSIISALHIKSSLSDMDATVANELLGEPGKMGFEVDAYEEKRRDASTSLIEAAKNITFDEAEQKPIEAIQVAMGTFEARVQHARDLHDRHDADYVNAYREAAQIMDKELLPEADKLDKVNHDELERIYASQKTRSFGAIFVVLAAGAMLLFALVGVQKFLNEKTHRILNPLLILTTLLTIGFVLYSFSVFVSEGRQLRIAKEDSFHSLYALWGARAVGYAAHADESRYLLDSAHASDHEAAFSAKAAALAKLPDNMSLAEAVRAARNDQITGFRGFLADELNNITFKGEKEAAVATLANFEVFMGIDENLRQLQRGGHHAEAVALCTGKNPTESDGSFAEFDKAITQTLQINQDAFEDAVGRGFAAVSYFELKASIVAVAIALLAYFGLLTRMREYQ